MRKKSMRYVSELYMGLLTILLFACMVISAQSSEPVISSYTPSIDGKTYNQLPRSQQNILESLTLSMGKDGKSVVIKKGESYPIEMKAGETGVLNFILKKTSAPTGYFVSIDGIPTHAAKYTSAAPLQFQFSKELFATKTSKDFRIDILKYTRWGWTIVQTKKFSLTLLPTHDPKPPQKKCQPIAPILLAGYDASPALQKAKIQTGLFTGGYTVAENDSRLVWYFSNLALLGFVDQIPGDVKTYLNLYLTHLNPNFSIDDVYFKIVDHRIDFNSPERHQSVPGEFSDSDDSYAATFLSLAARYYHVTCDAQWLNSTVSSTKMTVLETLKSIATKNLLNSQWPNGLIHVFQSAPAYYIAYTEDNAEAFRGLMDLADLLDSLEDPSAKIYRAAGERISAAMASMMYSGNLRSGKELLNQGGFYYYWGNAAAFSSPAQPLNSPLQFYPDAVTQIFPQAYRLGLPQPYYDAGWKFLKEHFPDYKTFAYDTDPWMLIGFAAAIQGDATLSQQMQTKTMNSYISGGVVPINNWGFFRRTSVLLQKGGIY